MEPSVLIGFAMAVGLPIVAIILGAGENSAGFLDVQSFLITVLGSMGACLIALPGAQLLNARKVFAKIVGRSEGNLREIVDQLVRFSERARREGLLALEDALQDVDDYFMRGGFQLAIDGVEPEVIRDILQTDMAFMEDRHKTGRNIFDVWGAFAPAFGMIGTLIGLIIMMQNLSDPQSIGPPMAVALLTTLYGALMANAILLPTAEKLKIRSSEELLTREMIIEGIMSLQAGENPRLLHQRLMAYLKPGERSTM